MEPLERFIIAAVIGYVGVSLLEPRGWAFKPHGRPVNITDEENKIQKGSFYQHLLEKLYEELRHAHIHLNPNEGGEP